MSAVFKITDETDAELDQLLEMSGYEILTPTYLMTVDLSARKYTPGTCNITASIDDEWLSAYFTLSHYTEEKKKSIAKQVYENIRVSVLCGRIIKNTATVACGLCAIERGYAGLYNIVVEESERGKGYGKEICQSLLAEAQSLGAHTAYLQVVQNNNVAIDLYAKLGYETIYSYWYRVKKDEGLVS